MPPKVKFSKETMIGTALQFVREQGMASLTARALAEKPFRSVGVAYILFASKEPQLFQLLFQNPSKDPIRRFQDFLPMKDHSYQLVLDSIVADFPLTSEEASRLYQHLFI